MPNFFVDIHQDLVYAYGCPSRMVRPIWRVKRAPKRAYASFWWFSCDIAHHFLGDPDSEVKMPNFFWMSVKTLSMHMIFHHRLYDPFGGSEEPRSEHTPHFDDFRVLKHTIFWAIWIPTSEMQNLFVDICQDLVNAFRWFSFAIAHHFLGDPDANVKIAKFFRGGPSRPCLCIRLAITEIPGHLEGQTSPEASIRLISTIFVCYSTPFFGWYGFRRQKCQIFFVDFRKDLVYA